MPSAKTVYIVRHGQSEDNAAPVFQSYDSPLSAIGKKQAQVLAERATQLKFDTILTSPQIRAKETAQAISAATSKEIEVSELFVERGKPAAIDGKPWSNPAASKLWREWNKSMTTPGLRAQDGENFDDIVRRADKTLAFLENRNEESLLVVTHGYFIRTMIARIMLGPDLTGEMLKRITELTALENTSITVLKFKDAFEEDFRWRLWTLNDRAHFAD